MTRLCLLFLVSSAVCAGQTPPATFADVSAQAAAARSANALPQAIEVYKKALQMKPDWQEGLWFLGTLSYDSNQYTESRDALARFVELRPDSGPAWGLLGLSEFETKQYTQSLSHIERSFAAGIGGAPEMEEVLRYHEALLLTKDGEYDEAARKYVWFAKKGEQSPPLLLGIGLAALRSPRVPSEVPDTQWDLYATAGKASYFAMAGDLGSAQEGFQDLLRRYPAAPNVHYLYGCYLLETNPDVAIEELKKELQVNPSSTAAKYMLAWALVDHGEYAAARPYASQAVHDAPAMPIAQYVLGRALMETGDVKEGIEHLEKAEKMSPMNVEVHITLAAAYSKAGRSDDARREREQSLAMTRNAKALVQP